MNIGRFLNILDDVLTLGYARRSRALLKGKSDYTLVTAGDPCVFLRLQDPMPKLGKSIIYNKKVVNLSDFKVMQVLGNSMSPKEINNGDLIFAKPYNVGTEIKEGSFLIIEVDKDYYKEYKHEEVYFEYKLRRSLIHVHRNMNLQDIVDSLKDIDHEEILLPRNIDNLTEKLELARRAYPTEELILSTTYKNGVMKYSLHPERLVRCVACYRAAVRYGEIKGYKILKSA